MLGSRFPSSPTFTIAMQSASNRSIVALSLLLGLAFTSALKAEVLTYTLSGVTTYNQVSPVGSSVNTEFPVGTPWKLVVSWDTDGNALYSGDTQSQFRLLSCELTFNGVSGDWTTAALEEKAAFGLNIMGSNHEIQFTSGWGPENHTNGTIGDMQPFSANVTLSDTTGTAIQGLTPAPTSLNLSSWGNTQSNQFKLYLNNNGNQVIYGSVLSVKAPGDTILMTETYPLGGGWSWNLQLGYLYTGYYPFVWLHSTENWLYIFEEVNTTDSAFFFYDFGAEQTGWTGYAYYPDYVIIGGERDGQWVSLVPAQ